MSPLLDGPTCFLVCKNFFSCERDRKKHLWPRNTPESTKLRLRLYGEKLSRLEGSLAYPRVITRCRPTGCCLAKSTLSRSISLAVCVIVYFWLIRSLVDPTSTDSIIVRGPLQFSRLQFCPREFHPRPT